MLRNLTLSAAAAVLFALPVAAQTRVGSLEVSAPLSVLGNPEAGALWAGLEADLANAIAARLVPQVAEPDAPGAARVTVTIEEFRLPAAMGLSPEDEGVLAGNVRVVGSADNESVDLRISTPRPPMPVMPADPVAAQAELNALHYATLLDAFADRVADTVRD